jgi:hypothetical protein
MGLWHRSSGVFTGCVKSEYGAATGKKKAQYGAPRAPERAPFKGRVDGSSPHPPLAGHSEERGAYSVLSSDVLEWYVFYANLVRFKKNFICVSNTTL